MYPSGSSQRHSSKTSHKTSSKKYEYQWVWTCCQCGDSGMSCNSTPGCPSCNVYRCANCPLQQVKVRVA
ncbi:hypothetical protein CKAH01_08147 [Colletotrichum kahawae]|uniref:Uncharacterized protein n=1 Tax=Colletotrichum kahawae TaxID=34407 RepID=A0AAD9Y4A9_COLKA|nr:hypothetical protein CcaCcLH18_12816 [Colletotrichum camelliae]KAK2734103.1 hypothetical protein CKAH01_08147 [Colletotrichum kahawae]